MRWPCYLLGLDPIAETLADGHSYGFRRERCCADALDECHKILSGPYSPSWILEGDIKACFDRISHNWLMDNIPLDKELLRKWLKAGFLEKHQGLRTTFSCVFEGFSRELSSHYIINTNCNALYSPIHYRKVTNM